MAEYIEREATIKLLRSLGSRDYRREKGTIQEAIKMVSFPEYTPSADVEPVRHGWWMHTKKHLWYKNKDGSIDEWRLDVGFHNGPECQVCGEAVCMHCHPDWESMECEIGHYLCSVCGEVSIDAHENYCPNCGAKMDGDKNE